MKITYQWLASHNACQSGLRWFKKRFPSGCDTDKMEDLNRWNYKGHLVDVIMFLASGVGDFKRCRVHVPSCLEFELYRYITGAELDDMLFDYPTLYVHRDLMWLPENRLRKCLQQVAERVSW